LNLLLAVAEDLGCLITAIIGLYFGA